LLFDGFGVDAVVFGQIFDEGGGDAPSERRRLGLGGFLRWFGGWGVAGFGCGVWRLGLSLPLLGGEVGGGDLQGVEDEAGAAGVDVVGGKTGENLSEGDLDSGSAGGCFEVEGVGAGAAAARVGDGLAGVVVVVTEVGAAK
jgi:hypothetical protein